MAKMLKVRCTWVDRPTANGYMSGMVFEAQEHPYEDGFFVRGKLLWCRRKDEKHLIPKDTGAGMPLKGNLWHFEWVK